MSEIKVNTNQLNFFVFFFKRQFKEAAKERYFKNLNLAIYFHSCIAEYFMGTWGGGTPKPFKYTEIQRMR